MKKIAKKNKKYLFVLGSMALLAPVSFVAAACGSEAKSETKGKTEDKGAKQNTNNASKPSSTTKSNGVKTKQPVTATSIRIAITDPDNPRWVRAQKDFVANLDLLDLAADTNIVKNQNEQNQFLSTAIDRGAKGVIIAPVDGGQVGVPLSKAEARNIPVVAYDRLITSGNKPLWYTSYSNALVGKLQGLALASGLLGAPAPFKTVDEMKAYYNAHKPTSPITFFTLGGSINDNNAKYFYNGAMEVLNVLIELSKNETNKITVLGQNGQNQVLQSDWDYDEGQRRLKAELAKIISKPEEKAKFKGVLAPNDGMARAAINAIEQSKMDATKIYITGQDLNDYAVNFLKNGKQNISIYKPDSNLSFLSIVLLNTLIENNKNTANKLTDQQIFEEVAKKYKEKYGQDVAIEFDTTSYQVREGVNAKAILIQPVEINKENVDKYANK